MTTTADDMRRVLEILDEARDNMLWAYHTLSFMVIFKDFIAAAAGAEESLIEMLGTSYKKMWAEVDEEDPYDRFASDTTGLPRNLPEYFCRIVDNKAVYATEAEVKALWEETREKKLPPQYFWNKYAKEYYGD